MYQKVSVIIVTEEKMHMHYRNIDDFF